jgi:thioredoxin reductase (NADPH)
MARIGIVGDGPGGLSAALFLAKNGHEVVVYGKDRTAMHYAHLHNYLGLPDMPGTRFQEVARGQVIDQGAELVDSKVVGVSNDEGLVIKTEDDEVPVDYLILTEGKNPALAVSLGLSVGADGRIAVDPEFRSSIDRVYVVGRSVRPTRSQAIISAGAGATAALDILAREAGSDVQDWDTPPKE